MQRPAALARLDVFVGEWAIDAQFAPERGVELSAGERPTVSFEWILGDRYLLQKSHAPDPIPESSCLIALDGNDDERFVQHYFDSRGVTRIYEMTFDGRTWTLTREKPDFSPLEFKQRFTGTFEDGNTTIRGGWEICNDGSTWETDFGLVYTRLR